MKLILDTTRENMSIILADGAKVLASSIVNDSKHQQHLLPELEKLLSSNGWTLNDIGEYAVSIGPGSFTGIRLGIATIKALSIAFTDRKTYPINMLELATSKVKTTPNFAVLIKCTSSRVYMGYMENGSFKTLTLENDKALDLIEKMHLMPFALDMEVLNNIKTQNITLSPQDFAVFCDGKKGEKASTLEPLYMALSQAEEELNKKEKK